MKNALILAAIAAAVVVIVGLKVLNKSDKASSCCPCSAAQASVTNEAETGSSTVE